MLQKHLIIPLNDKAKKFLDEKWVNQNFGLDKEDRFPRPILNCRRTRIVTRKAEIPKIKLQEYVPQHVLSPEFEGISNYERGVDEFLEEAKQNLKH